MRVKFDNGRIILDTGHNRMVLTSRSWKTLQKKLNKINPDGVQLSIGQKQILKTIQLQAMTKAAMAMLDKFQPNINCGLHPKPKP